jgi:glycosyltransferase involved in cell wall biosynthesis
MTLTIAIPTYNRPDKIKNTLLRLIPQLNSNVFIRVLDNHSDVNIKEHVANDIPEGAAHQVEIIRHKINIGGDANFARCFELCETPYIWMLGDDDRVDENAIETILNGIEKYKDHDLIGINFSSNVCLVKRSTSVLIQSTTDLVEKLDFFGNLLFISTSIYRTDEYRKNLRHTAWGAYSMASQVVPVLLAVSNNKVLVLSDKHLVDHVHVEDIKDKWSDVQITLSLSTILETPIGLKKNHHLKLGKHFNTNLYISIPNAFFTILKTVNFNVDLIDDYHVYLFRQIFYRTVDIRPDRVKNYLYYYLILFLLETRFTLKLLLNLFPGWFKSKAAPLAPFHLFSR